MDLQLRGRRALVTGGSRGIGLAVARALLAEGAQVAIAARDADRLDAAAADLRARTENGQRVFAVKMETGIDESVREGVAAVVEALGGIDILVNCAAIPGGQTPPPKLADITDENFFADVNVKVLGYLRCAREVAPLMIPQHWGRIINVSGLAARQTGAIIGSVRNVGVAALTKNLADELGRYGINVTVVHPGMTRTEKTADTFAAQAESLGVPLAEIEARAGSRVAIGRIVEAAEVADVVAFLASPRSIAITGDAVAVAGGALGAIHY